MLKMFCICDRCKKQFEAKQAKRIVFEPTLTLEETWGSKLVEMVANFFRRPSALLLPGVYI